MPYVDWIIIQCYMGWRPQELATLKLGEINLEHKFKGCVKQMSRLRAENLPLT